MALIEGDLPIDREVTNIYVTITFSPWSIFSFSKNVFQKLHHYFFIFDALSLSAQLDYKLESKRAVELIEYTIGLHLAKKGVSRPTPSFFLNPTHHGGGDKTSPPIF